MIFKDDIFLTLVLGQCEKNMFLKKPASVSKPRQVSGTSVSLDGRSLTEDNQGMSRQQL